VLGKPFEAANICRGTRIGSFGGKPKMKNKNSSKQKKPVTMRSVSSRAQSRLAWLEKREATII